MLLFLSRVEFLFNAPCFRLFLIRFLPSSCYVFASIFMLLYIYLYIYTNIYKDIRLTTTTTLDHAMPVNIFILFSFCLTRISNSSSELNASIKELFVSYSFLDNLNFVPNKILNYRWTKLCTLWKGLNCTVKLQAIVFYIQRSSVCS